MWVACGVGVFSLYPAKKSTPTCLQLCRLIEIPEENESDMGAEGSPENDESPAHDNDNTGSEVSFWRIANASESEASCILSATNHNESLLFRSIRTKTNQQDRSPVSA